MKNYRINPVIKMKVVELMDDGLSRELVAERTGLSPDAIVRVMREHRNALRAKAAAKPKPEPMLVGERIGERAQKATRPGRKP